MKKKNVLEEYFNQLIKKEKLIPKEDIFGIRYIFSEGKGKYYLKRMFLEEGMDLTFCSLPSKFKFVFETNDFKEDILEFCFCMEGEIKIVCQSSKETYYFSKNQVCLYYFKNQEESFSFYNKESKSFSVHVHLDYLQSLFRFGKGEVLEKEWEKNVREMLQAKFLRVWKASPSLQQLGREIMESKFNSILDYFSFRAKIASFLVKFMLEAMEICDEKEEALQSIKMLVERDYSVNYSLEEISSVLHLPIYRLQEYCKDKKEMTLSEYIRSIKLLYAVGLLEERKYNVAEVASMIGYDNPSKFSMALYKKYGRKPKDIKKKKI